MSPNVLMTPKYDYMHLLQESIDFVKKKDEKLRKKTKSRLMNRCKKNTLTSYGLKNRDFLIRDNAI